MTYKGEMGGGLKLNHIIINTENRCYMEWFITNRQCMELRRGALCITYLSIVHTYYTHRCDT